MTNHPHPEISSEPYISFNLSPKTLAVLPWLCPNAYAFANRGLGPLVLHLQGVEIAVHEANNNKRYARGSHAAFI